jgi:hypothetical protein
MQKLTEEQKVKIIDFLNEVLFNEEEEPSDPEYITEYDILMKNKEEEFKLYILNSPNIESVIEMCDKHLEEKKNPQDKSFGSEFGLIMLYDMWINECSFWPTNNPELWDKWEKLKKIRVKRREK